jgi:hypothetical protein
LATNVVIAKPSSEHRLKIGHQCALFAILTPFFAVREILGRMLVANPAMIPDIRLSEQPETWDGRATFGGYCAEFVAQNSSSKPSRKMTARNELRIAKKPSRFDRLMALAYLVVTLSGLAWAKEFLLPIVLAGFTSFLLAPLISRLERVGLKPVFAVLAGRHRFPKFCRQPGKSSSGCLIA